ncbi:MAG: MOSC domain-containing protein [Hylemonella sp.]|nr:MOSC domain-containing protein [Hylemonella sp.]MDH5709095.1 MOSC domain-containing protein [Hylemonella sp.]
MRILSVNVGHSREIVIKGRSTQTGFDKTPTEGRVPVHLLGLQDDVRVEPRKMGLENHAVYAYPHEHYAHWQQLLAREPFPMGQFGENLTVSGLLEETVRIGDVFRFGSAVLQVAQPRIPCAKLNERMGFRFSPQFQASRKVGYYLRVLQEGDVAAGDAIQLLERDPNSPSMEEFVRISQYEYWDARGLRGLLHARDLMPAWQEMIEAKLARTISATGGWHGLREFCVVRRDEEGPDTVSLTLHCARGQGLPIFKGGQYLTVVLGAHTAQQHRRYYALTSRPDDTWAYRICVRRHAPKQEDHAAGLLSSHLLQLEVGQAIMCGAPSGQMVLPAAGADSGRLPVLLSQGIGIAPMLGLLHELKARQAPQAYMFHQPSGADPQLLMQEIESMVKAHPGFHLVRLAATDANTQEPSPTIDAQLLGSQLSLAQADFYIVGPRSFVESTRAELLAAGVSAAALTTQDFG